MSPCRRREAERLDADERNGKRTACICARSFSTHLAAANFCNSDLRRVNFGTRLRYANFSRAWLSKIVISASTASKRSFNFAHLERSNVVSASLQGASLLWHIFQGANLAGARLQGVELQRASLAGANLWAAELHGANLQSAQISAGPACGTLNCKALISTGRDLGCLPSWAFTWRTRGAPMVLEFARLDQITLDIRSPSGTKGPKIEMPWCARSELSRNMVETILRDVQRISLFPSGHLSLSEGTRKPLARVWGSSALVPISRRNTQAVGREWRS